MKTIRKRSESPSMELFCRNRVKDSIITTSFKKRMIVTKSRSLALFRYIQIRMTNNNKYLVRKNPKYKISINRTRDCSKMLMKVQALNTKTEQLITNLIVRFQAKMSNKGRILTIFN